MSEQCLHQFDITGQNRGVQRCITRRSRIGIGAFLEQKSSDGAVTAVSRHDQSGRAGGGRVVGVGPGRRQQPGRLEVALHGREEQWRVAAQLDVDRIGWIRGGQRVVAVAADVEHLGPHLRPGRDVGARLDERFHYVGMPLRDGPHERGLAAQLLFEVEVGAVSHERFHGGDIAGTGGRHQRRLARRQPEVRIRVGAQKPRDHRCAAIRAGDPQGGRPFIVCGIDRSTRPNQKLGGLEIIPIGRPVQSRRAVTLRRGHVDPLLEQLANRRPVILLRRLDQPGVARRCHCRGASDGEYREQPSDPATADAFSYHCGRLHRVPLWRMVA